MSDDLDRVFAALADPTRRQILQMLLEDDMAVTDVAAPFEMSLAAISKHLGVLTRAGLVTQERRGRVKWCHLEPDALRAASVWMQAFGQFEPVHLDAFERFLAHELGPHAFDPPEGGPTPDRATPSPDGEPGGEREAAPDREPEAAPDWEPGGEPGAAPDREPGGEPEAVTDWEPGGEPEAAPDREPRRQPSRGSLPDREDDRRAAPQARPPVRPR